MRGYPWATHRIQQLKRFRKQGYSIHELAKKFDVPIATVWVHVKDVQLSNRSARIIAAKKGGSTVRKQLRWEIAQEDALALFDHHRSACIALAMLYWGEGNKKVCEFINSDGQMVRLYLLLLRTVLKVPDAPITPTLRYFTGMNRQRCLNYWAEITTISPGKFKINYNDGGTRGRTEFGLCRITVNRGGAQTHKVIMSLIWLVSRQMLQPPAK